MNTVMVSRAAEHGRALLTGQIRGSTPCDVGARLSRCTKPRVAGECKRHAARTGPRLSADSMCTRRSGPCDRSGWPLDDRGGDRRGSPGGGGDDSCQSVARAGPFVEAVPDFRQPRDVFRRSRLRPRDATTVCGEAVASNDCSAWLASDLAAGSMACHSDSAPVRPRDPPRAVGIPTGAPP